jgi:DnaJ family protein C protein 22
MSKTLHIAYICWLIGGLFGLHHAYLRKDKHALIYFSTLGGFLICWLVDVFRIPSYVREANRDDYYTAKLESTKNQLKAPSFHGFRFFGSILVGVFYSFIIKYTLSTEHIFFIVLFKIISACIIALLIYLVGTEEPMQCEFKWPLLGSLVGVLLPESLSIYGCPILSALFLNWNVFWSDEISLAKQQDRKLFKRLAIFSIYSFVLVLLISLFVWNNTTIEMNGKKVNLKDAVYEFWNSKEMEKTCEILRIAWNFYRAHGI